MPKYKILTGALYDRRAKKMREIGAVIELTEAQAKVYGLSLLRRVDAVEPVDPQEPVKPNDGEANYEAILEEIKPLPAAEAVEKYNALEGVEPVTSKVAAITALEALIKQ